jgi:quercetin dioxygenase-like cupin family protein
MYKVLTLTLFVLSLSCVVQAQDPVKVDSQHYTVEFENSQVRVLRIKVGAHEKSVMHRHPNAVAIFLTDASGRFNFPKGAAQDFTSKAGQVQWTPGVVHLPENTSDQPFELILVELKSKPVKKVAKKPATTPAATPTKQPG